MRWKCQDVKTNAKGGVLQYLSMIHTAGGVRYEDR